MRMPGTWARVRVMVSAKIAAPPSATSSRSTEVITTYWRFSVRTASATRVGSPRSRVAGLPCDTAQ
jgi:hypothetical protein